MAGYRAIPPPQTSLHSAINATPTFAKTDIRNMLTVEKKTVWQDKGFLVLEQFFTEEEVDTVNAVYDRVWEERPRDVVVDVLATNRRTTMARLTDNDAQSSHFKVNDLYLSYPEIRSVCLAPRVVDVLTALLGEAPILCNTLNLIRGSQQDIHIDSLYMTPRTPGGLVASWLALENAHPDSGQLVYFPGSHQIPLYRFSNGGHHALPGELDAWKSYIERQVAERGREAEHFSARKGDLFIWHANLLHGGSPIRDAARTRKSLVSHFWTRSDCEAHGCRVEKHANAGWYDRPPQPVPSFYRSLSQTLHGIVSRIKRAV